MPSLDRIALENGVQPVSSFTPVPGDFDGDPGELEELLCGEWDDWFPTDEGIRTLDAVVSVLESDPQAAEPLLDAGEVMDLLKTHSIE